MITTTEKPRCGSSQIVRHELLAIIKNDARLRQIWHKLEQQNSSDASHDSEHLVRAACWTYNIMSAESEEIVHEDLIQGIAAALLHDFVNLPKDHTDRHLASTLSSKIATDLFNQVGFNHDQCIAMSSAIKTHSFSYGAVPESLLGCALQDADRLEALGAIGIFRCFNVAAQMGAKLFNPSDPWAKDRCLDDRAFSLDHFAVKLLTLHAKMNTKTGKNEALRRTEILKQYLENLKIEIGSG
jgi:uncharacterized protein